MLIKEPPVKHYHPEPHFQPSTKRIEHAQETIYEFLINTVKQCSPEVALTEFESLFVHSVNMTSSEVNQALYQIIVSNDEQEFRNTLKRSCYILINNWNTSKNYQAIQQLVGLFPKIKFNRKTASLILTRLNYWLEKFIGSSDYQELELFVSACTFQPEKPWSRRYTSYLLVSQFVNTTNSAEQRETARVLSRQLKEQYKRDLALYVARSQSSVVQKNPLKNPTLLGDEVLLLIKRLVAKKCVFSYTNLANIFLKQTQELSYYEFKRGLKKYLIYSMSNQDLAASVKKSLFDSLESLYEIYDEREIDDALLLRTCNRVIECLTTENRKEPTSLFALFVMQKSPITLVILLLKIILICKNSRTHLESCIADLIRYYENLNEEDCQWVIHFLEVFSVIFTVYAEDVEYNLVKVDSETPNSYQQRNLEAYQIFSQLRGNVPLETSSQAEFAIAPTAEF
ncbi:MAG: hypothetical protein KME12_21145 [Trichocoleus desertorum ATA4-8-CV12]|jgi:hypothetical protein|nr:hypothetical protein [Trichocoleus desertorum ATA4-8-CV12]